MYKILYCRFSGGQRLVVLFDFLVGQTIEFSLDELEKEELTEELKEYIRGIREGINSGYYDYSL
ncbi:hypothetical protein P9E34_19580 [Schinkia azotoformans]|uniref:hypothetical protein n=1 Tax=Schinkia azotoformans TaxID=1454 RepID=UPI002DBC7BDD|nr:hypothetical protein [Schinkia azotoformans]MEC1726913.1 hypothetical protein [Schinkia azotoformans]